MLHHDKLTNGGGKKYAFHIISTILLLSIPARTQEISLFGTVTDTDGAALENVAVRLAKHPAVSAATDENGSFHLTGNVSTVNRGIKSTSALSVQCTGNTIRLSINRPTAVSMELFTVSGQRLEKILDEVMPPGHYALPVFAEAAAQIVIARVRCGTDIRQFTMNAMQPFVAVKNQSSRPFTGVLKRKTSNAASPAAIDTLVFTREGFVTHPHVLSSYTPGDSIRITMRPVTILSEALRKKVVAATEAIKLDVQSFRGKNFKRAISVNVYTRSQYAAQIGDNFDTTSQKTKDLHNSVLRLEGLLRSGQDFFATRSHLLSGGVGGFYVNGTDSLYIVVADDAIDLSLDDSVCIFHELVHALQDHYFDLTSFMGQSTTSDRYYARSYTIEGEAVLLSDYYHFKLTTGLFPATSEQVVQRLEENYTKSDARLDSLHQTGEPLISLMPIVWQYYSYGPQFINTVAGTQWKRIDTILFANPPLRMFEVLHPNYYMPSNEYALNVQLLLSAIAGSNTLVEGDELGELLTRVMFREWDFSSYNDIADGMLADYIVVYRGTSPDSLGMVWNTCWHDTSAAAVFFTAYAGLVNKKRGITLPAPVTSGTRSFINDTLNRIYIEKNAGYIFTIENYRKATLDTYANLCRGVQVYKTTVIAKKTADRFPEIPRVGKYPRQPGKPFSKMQMTEGLR